MALEVMHNHIEKAVLFLQNGFLFLLRFSVGYSVSVRCLMVVCGSC